MELYNQLRNKEKLFLIAGPCVVEDEVIMYKTAQVLKEETEKRGITFIFKSSYKKANRTAITSFQGPGMGQGLELLAKLKSDFGFPILTDVHETGEVNEAADVADILQIPAFLSRQTALIQKAANTGRIVNIKKAQFMAPEDIKNAADKVTAENNYQVLLTERGTSFGYHNLVVDFRSFIIMSGYGFPVIYDVTHSMQKPSLHHTSGGTPEYAPMMARAAMATGYVDGLFIETHPAPIEALSDASSMIPLADMPLLLDQCVELFEKRNLKDRKWL